MRKAILLLSVIFISLSGRSQTDVNNVQMVFVKGGSYFMGCDDPQFAGDKTFDKERPRHRVTVNSFYMGKYEITLGQWRKLMGLYPPSYTGVDYVNKDCDECPVVKVSWEDVQEFIRRLNLKFPNKHYRLPTETEWEFAARGGRYSKAFPYAGSAKLKDVAWYGKPDGAAHPIGQKAPNELEIFDMSGNVMEWCADWYDEAYYKGTVDELNPKGPKTGELKVVRGGSYYDDDITCRTVNRYMMAPDSRKWNLGFRLATDAPEGK